MNLGVLVSGRGSNLQNLLDLYFPVVAVATNRDSCGGAHIARERKLPLGVFAQRDFESASARDTAMGAWLRQMGVELVICAGYDRVMTAGLLDAYPGRILNIHPSLLPAFGGGMDAVKQALEHGVKITGCTVHLVDAAVDGGPILAQAAVAVHEDDTPESLHSRIQAQEHRILPEAIRMLSDRLSATRPPLR